MNESKYSTGEGGRGESNGAGEGGSASEDHWRGETEAPKTACDKTAGIPTKGENATPLYTDIRCLLAISHAQIHHYLEHVFVITHLFFLFSFFTRVFSKKMIWSTLMRISKTVSNNVRLIFSQMRVGEMISSRVITVMTTRWRSF